MNVEIAERLAARRKLAGLSQEALAEKLGVSRQAVSKWERSESSPDTDNLIALAKLYGVSLDELLYVDESIEDDVAFEAADRAEARGASWGCRRGSFGRDGFARGRWRWRCM
ncbi:MAG: helix-turn-helix transcriptional regulator [Adlercreutzia equolifaciens]